MFKKLNNIMNYIHLLFITGSRLGRNKLERCHTFSHLYRHNEDGVLSAGYNSKHTKGKQNITDLIESIKKEQWLY